MFFSKEQVEQSLKRLEGLSPFFGTVFLAFKKADIPVGETVTIKFIPLINEFLETYCYFYQTASNSNSRRIYNPFKTSKKDSRWNKMPYNNSLYRTAATFTDALNNQKNNQWGWQSNYVSALQLNHLKDELIPAFDLAVWLFKNRRWSNNLEPKEVINAFLSEFKIKPEEYSLFNLKLPPLEKPWLQKFPLDDETLLSIVGSPLTEGAIIQKLRLDGIGPAIQIELDLASRLNLLTGDNGLGKTFLLECAWWALTGTWAGYPARPRQDVAKGTPRITFQVGAVGSQNEEVARYNWDQLKWVASSNRDVLAGLTIYSQANGSFVVWDPAKHRLTQEARSAGREEETLTRFSSSEVWNGVRPRENKVLCNGLLYDWTRWQEAADQIRFEELSAALEGLSPDSKEEPLIPGKPVSMLEIGDDRDIPTLRFPYGDVPILLCSAGIQRIVALAYILVWAWQSHIRTAESMRKEPERSIVLLIDEMEAHLHPKWQRMIVPALIQVINKLAHNVHVQIIIATHSPLVLASVENIFDDEKDKLFHLSLVDGLVRLTETDFVKRGRVDKWLISDIFGLEQPRSKDAEDAIEAAKELQRKRTPSKEEVQEVSNRLLNVLAQDDDFWPRWTYFAEQRGASL